MEYSSVESRYLAQWNLNIFIFMFFIFSTGTLPGSGSCPTFCWNDVWPCQHEEHMFSTFLYVPTLALCMCPTVKMSGTSSMSMKSLSVGVVMVDEEPHKIEAGDVVFIPDGSTHYLINEEKETLSLFWAIAKSWSELPDIQKELGKWREVKQGSEWSSSGEVK